ncbi:unnamed protein product [Protopolystoma xenopodis]|uniref:Secreted protein n=1 Tax=Protopolystoma xenopodis TaxID=117903 RepID=A0A3S4ZM15_9PLAT|nr:unnamed protein product [Protopolystoma xenopodis]
MITFLVIRFSGLVATTCCLHFDPGHFGKVSLSQFGCLADPAVSVGHVVWLILSAPARLGLNSVGKTNPTEVGNRRYECVDWLELQIAHLQHSGGSD